MTTDLARSENIRRIENHARPMSPTPAPWVSEAAISPALSLRTAGTDDEQAVRDLAALDDAKVPQGELLLALIDGEPVAGLSLRDGHVVANPFVHTEGAVALLRLRAEHISAGAGAAGARSRPAPALCVSPQASVTDEEGSWPSDIRASEPDTQTEATE